MTLIKFSLLICLLLSLVLGIFSVNTVVTKFNIVKGNGPDEIVFDCIIPRINIPVTLSAGERINFLTKLQAGQPFVAPLTGLVDLDHTFNFGDGSSITFRYAANVEIWARLQ